MKNEESEKFMQISEDLMLMGLGMNILAGFICVMNDNSNSNNICLAALASMQALGIVSIAYLGIAYCIDGSSSEIQEHKVFLWGDMQANEGNWVYF